MKHCSSLILIITFLATTTVKASNVIAADITYSTLNNKQIEIQVTRYRLVNDKDTNAIQIGLNIGGQLFYQVASRNYSTIYTLNCDTIGAHNSNSLGVLLKDQFKTIFNLNTTKFDSLIKQYCVLTFFYTDSARWNKVNTVNPSQKYYVEAMLNYCVFNAKQITPAYANTPLFELTKVDYNCGYSNSNNIDSFSFELVDAQDSFKKSLKYSQNYLNGKLPINPFCTPPGVYNCKPIPSSHRGFYFNEINGDMVFFHNSGQVGVIVTRIHLYQLDSQKNLKRMGYITREMTMKGGSDAVKIINSKTNYSVCEGEKICINFATSLYSKTDTVLLNWDQSIPNAHLVLKDSTARVKEATFCWQTKEDDGRNAAYQFTVNANTTKCHVNSSASKGYQIFVKINPNKVKKSYHFTVCNQLALQANNSDFKSIRWEVYDDSLNRIAAASRFKDTIQLIKPYRKTYFVKSYINGNTVCFETDTLTNSNFNGLFHRTVDTSICQSNQTLNLDQYNLYRNKNSYWYDEYLNPIIGNTIDLSGLRFPLRIQTFYFLIPNANCKINDTINFTIYDTVKTNLNEMLICEDAITMSLFNNGFTKHSKGFWLSKPANRVDTNGLLNVKKGIYNYQLTYYYDSLYCRHSESMKISAEQLPIAIFTQDKTIGAPPALIKFTSTSTGNNLQYLWNFGDQFSVNNTSVLSQPSHNYDSAGMYSVTLRVKGNLCSDTILKKDLIVLEIQQHNAIQSPLTLNLKVYPNPAKGLINIDTKLFFDLKILNEMGQVVTTCKSCSSLKLNNGLYFLHFTFENEVVIKKVIILD